MAPYACTTTTLRGVSIHSSFVSMAPEGILAVRCRYAWDGTSGPAIDTKTIMRASLVHDALYQLMRLGKLDQLKYRKVADGAFRRICLEDGMCGFRALYLYWGVRLFAAGASEPKGAGTE